MPGGREYLYSGEVTPSTHGRQPGTLASLEMNRENATRRILAELGIPPESAAVSLKATKDALLAAMPDKAHAMTQTELFEKAGVITKTTGQRALADLLEAKFGAPGKVGCATFIGTSGGKPATYSCAATGGMLPRNLSPRRAE